MKKILNIMAVAVVFTSANLVAHSQNPTKKITKNTVTDTPEQRMVGVANPASVFCVKNGGEVIIRKSADGGEYGICKFSDGTEIEEWEYFRKNNEMEGKGSLKN